MITFDFDELNYRSTDIDINMNPDGSYELYQTGDGRATVAIKLVSTPRKAIENDSTFHIVMKVMVDLGSIEEHPSSKE